MPARSVPEDWRPEGVRYRRLKSLARVGGGLTIAASAPVVLLVVWNVLAGTAEATPRWWGMAAVSLAASVLGGVLVVSVAVEARVGAILGGALGSAGATLAALMLMIGGGNPGFLALPCLGLYFAALVVTLVAAGRAAMRYELVPEQGD